MENLCCQNPECKSYSQRGQDNLTLRKTYGADRIRYLRCRDCGEESSGCKGTALFNCKLREAQAVSVIEHLDSHCGMNATARLVGVSKVAVRPLVRVTGRVSLSCMMPWSASFIRRPCSLTRSGPMWGKNRAV